MIKNRVTFWIQAAGWSGLISGIGLLEMYKVTGSWMFLLTLGIVVIFSAYLLATAQTSRWNDPNWILKIMIFCLVFVSLLQAIFLWFAYRAAKKNQRPKV